VLSINNVHHSLGHLHDDLGGGDEEGGGEELVRGEIGCEGGESLHAVVESLEVGVRREYSLVVAEAKDGLNRLIQNEVDHGEVSAVEEVLLSEEAGDLGKTLNSFGDNCLLVIL